MVNPIKDDKQKWTLSNDGEDLRNMLISLSVWGCQKMGDQEEIIPQLIVEPEQVADLKALVPRYCCAEVYEYLVRYENRSRTRSRMKFCDLVF